MKYAKILLVFALVLACDSKTPTEPNGVTQLPQWPMFGRNLRNTSNAADPVEYYSGPQQGQIIWTVDFGPDEDCWTSPSIGPDGTIYMATAPPAVTADSGFVYGISPEGTIKWRFRTQGGNFATGAVGQDGSYFIGSGDKNLYAIDREGKLKWKKEIGSFLAEARPAITKSGEVVVAAGSGVTALNSETGEIIWFYERPVRFGFSPSIAEDGTIYAGTGTSLLALTKEGKRKWELSSFSASEVMIGYDGTLYFHVLRDSLFYALNPDGSLKWTFNLQGAAENNRPAMDRNGCIYALNSGIRPQKLYKLNALGRSEWELKLAKLVGLDGVFLNDTTPIVDGDGIITLAIGFTFTDNFYAINQNREIAWSITVEGPGTFIFPKPAISPDGTIYIAGDYSLNAIR